MNSEVLSLEENSAGREVRRDICLLSCFVGFLAVLVPVACKKTSTEQPGERPHTDLVKKAISRGALSPKPGPPIPAETTRIALEGVREPRGIAVSANGEIYVADTGNFRIVRLDPSGGEIASFGRQGTGPGEFTQLWKLAISNEEKLLVLDRESQWIQVYSLDGRFLTRFAGPGLQLYYPGGIAVAPDGGVVMVDTGLDRLVFLNPQGQSQGQPVTAIAGEPLKQPTDASFDSNGGLHVYQTAGERSPSLLLHRAPPRGSESKWIAIDAPSTRDSPRLVVGRDGRIYMTDPGAKGLWIYDGDGKIRHPVQIQGPEASPFELITGITIDSDGRIYVLDGGAGVIYRLTLPASR